MNESVGNEPRRAEVSDESSHKSIFTGGKGWMPVPHPRSRRAFFVGEVRREALKKINAASYKDFECIVPKRVAGDDVQDDNADDANDANDADDQSSKPLGKAEYERSKLPIPVPVDDGFPAHNSWLQLAHEMNTRSEYNEFDKAYETERYSFGGHTASYDTDLCRRYAELNPDASGKARSTEESDSNVSVDGIVDWIMTQDVKGYHLLDFPNAGDYNCKAQANSTPRDVLWRVLALSIDARNKAAIGRLWRRLAHVPVDAGGDSAHRKMCRAIAGMDANDPLIGFTPDALALAIGVQPNDVYESVVRKFAMTIGFLVLRVRKPALAYAMLRAALECRSFHGHDMLPWKACAHSKVMAHTLSGIVLVVSDSLFAGSWFMYDGGSKTQHKFDSTAQVERLSRYRRWHAFCELAMELITPHGFAESVVISTPTDWASSRADNSTTGSFEPLVRSAGSAGTQRGVMVPSKGQPRFFRTYVVTTLRLAFEASHVHSWPYDAMMKLPACNWGARTLEDQLAHIYMLPEQRAPSCQPIETLRPFEELMSFSRRLDYLVATYSKLVELGNAHPYDQSVVLVFHRFWSETLAGIGPGDSGSVCIKPGSDLKSHARNLGYHCGKGRDGRVSFERVVQRLLAATPPPGTDGEVCTVVDIVYAMSRYVTDNYKNAAQTDQKENPVQKDIWPLTPPSGLVVARVYMNAIIDITSAHPRFLRAAFPLLEVCSFWSCTNTVAETDYDLKRYLKLILDVAAEYVGRMDLETRFPSDYRVESYKKIACEYHLEPPSQPEQIQKGQKRLEEFKRQYTFLIVEAIKRGLHTTHRRLYSPILPMVEFLDKNCVYASWCASLRSVWNMVDRDESEAEGADPTDDREHHVELLARFVFVRTHGAPTLLAGWSNEVRLVYELETRKTLSTLLCMDAWTKRELDIALVTAAFMREYQCARTLMLPFGCYDQGVRVEQIDPLSWKMMSCGGFFSDEEAKSYKHYDDIESAHEFLQEIGTNIWGPDGNGSKQLFEKYEATMPSSNGKRALGDEVLSVAKRGRDA